MNRTTLIVLSAVGLMAACLLNGGIEESDPSSSAAMAAGWLYRIEEDGKWGLMDAAGRTVVTCTYDYIPREPVKPSEFHFVAKRGKMWMLVSRSAQVVAESTESILPVPPCRYLEGGKLIDLKTGKVLAEFAAANWPGEGLIPVMSKNGKWGFADYDGRMVIPHRFDQVGPFEDGLAPAKSAEGKWGFIGHSGQWVLRLDEGKAVSHSEGILIVRVDKKERYLRLDGKEAFPKLGVRIADPFTGGLARVLLADGRKGVIDRDGEFVIGPSMRLFSIGPLSEGLMSFAQKDKSGRVVARGYYDRSGEIVLTLPPQKYESWGSFHGPLARVSLPEGGFNWGYINRKGKLVWRSFK